MRCEWVSLVCLICDLVIIISSFLDSRLVEIYGDKRRFDLAKFIILLVLPKSVPTAIYEMSEVNF